MPEEDRDVVTPDEVLLRRCPEMPAQIEPPVDLVTASIKMPSSALSLKNSDDGISVYRKKLLDRDGVDCQEVRKNSCAVFMFAASIVSEARWGVFPDPQSDDAIIGFAHALIALTQDFAYVKTLHRSQLLTLRQRIIDAAKLMPVQAA